MSGSRTPGTRGRDPPVQQRHPGPGALSPRLSRPMSSLRVSPPQRCSPRAVPPTPRTTVWRRPPSSTSKRRAIFAS
ncbi:hypothetical protein ADK37_00650 [Streptomyces resistomycificus]|uniref:Uncharacterized protein n=1 Tax=Streptomyces resistomycificus TaxID=67356 RepID=A0A0L8M027_9ACTN|nr:hypothetical protein ADK37_00650 [Streptomyces resistomycificus]